MITNNTQTENIKRCGNYSSVLSQITLPSHSRLSGGNKLHLPASFTLNPTVAERRPQRTRVVVFSVLWKESSAGLISIKESFISSKILTVLRELKSFND